MRTVIFLILPLVSAATATVPDLGTASNNSLFAKWRPTFHFIGPNSWQNDPCMIFRSGMACCAD
jgi:sucrose-6-phosphate hydrolase SacC (GH32 family)